MSALFDIERLRSALESGTGKGVRIAMLDTGVDEEHPDLSGRIAASYDVARADEGYACVAAKGTDEVGHGTACAGIIKRIAPDAELHSIKVIGANARGSSDELIQGLRWAIDNKVNVISASLGTLDHRSRDKISALADEAYYSGIVLVAAANNRGQTAYPANLSSVLAVDSEAMEDPLAWRFRLNMQIEIEAKGIYVEAPSPGGGTKFYTGTSFACPHASGIVARILSAHPDLQPFEVRTVLRRLSQS